MFIGFYFNILIRIYGINTANNSKTTGETRPVVLFFALNIK